VLEWKLVPKLSSNALWLTSTTANYKNTLSHTHTIGFCLTGPLPRDARSAKRGIAIVSHPSVRPSLRLSVRNVDVP